jgi:hypothetical protein
VNSDSSFDIEGRPTDDAHPGPDEEIRIISPDYFRVLETPLLKGRFFTAADQDGAPPVTIINQALAKRYWPNEESLGKRIGIPGAGKTIWASIIGIVDDIHHRGLDLPALPEYYVPLAQAPYNSMILTVRSVQDPRGLTSSIRREVQAIDSAQPIAHVRTFEFSQPLLSFLPQLGFMA